MALRRCPTVLLLREARRMRMERQAGGALRCLRRLPVAPSMIAVSTRVEQTLDDVLIGGVEVEAKGLQVAAQLE